MKTCGKRWIYLKNYPEYYQKKITKKITMKENMVKVYSERLHRSVGLSNIDQLVLVKSRQTKRFSEF